MGFGGGDEAFEEAEIGVDGEVVVGDEDGAGDRSAHKAGFGYKGKDQSVALPGAAFIGEFDGERDGSGEDVVERAIDGLFDFADGAMVGDGNFHGQSIGSVSGGYVRECSGATRMAE